MSSHDVLEETIEEFGSDDLDKKIEKENLTAYVGYEPSGVLHIGHLITAQKLIDLQETGVNVKVLMADIHAKINGKGKLDEIQKTGKKMTDELLKFGLDRNDTETVFGSNFQYSKEYQDDLHKMNQTVTLNRAKRSMSEIAGSETEKVSNVVYPLMQALDIVHLDVDIAVGGMEQRKVHMLARDELPKIGYDKPDYIHTPLISDLNGKDNKMSSSEGSTISANDTPNEVESKINNAYCPREKSGNPVLELYEYLIFRQNESILVKRPSKYGGDITYNEYSKLEKDFITGDVHAEDIKQTLGKELNSILDPIRNS